MGLPRAGRAWEAATSCRKPNGELRIVRETEAGSELIDADLRDAAGFNHVSQS